MHSKKSNDLTTAIKLQIPRQSLKQVEVHYAKQIQTKTIFLMKEKIAYKIGEVL